MGYGCNYKHVYRVYEAMQLRNRRRARIRLPARAKQELMQPTRPHKALGYKPPQGVLDVFILSETLILVGPIISEADRETFKMIHK